MWIGAQRCPQALLDLVTRLAQGMRRLDIRTEARDYVPHITLLRRRKRGPDAFKFSAVEWRATEFV